MPPKKAKAEKSKAKEELGVPKQENSNGASGNSSSTIPSKRKAKPDNEPAKAPRRSARGASRTSVEPIKILRFLLSPASLELCRPQDEINDIKTRGADLRTYSSTAFNPFEELVCATVLSRPISHALGLRSIRTLFNDPYSFTTPKILREAGFEGRRKALDHAKTQHRQKTAEELGLLADAVTETLGDGEDDVSLERVRKVAGHNVEEERELIKKNVKGLAKTGLDIFYRRIQGAWPEAYPFADQRTLAAVEKLGLPGTAEELKDLVEEKWNDLNVEDIPIKNGDEKKRHAFVRVLERAVGADLEGKLDLVRTEAEKMLQ